MKTLWILNLLLVTLNGYSEGSSQEEELIPYKFAAEPTLPEFIVFDCDETIWPFKFDDVMTPPLVSNGPLRKRQIKDSEGKIFQLFPESASILQDLFNRWYKVGGIIRTNDTEKLENVVKLFDVDRFFKLYQAFPEESGTLTEYLEKICQRAEVPVDEMLYFGSSEADVAEAKALKAVTVHVPRGEGITMQLIQQGFKLYYEAMKHTLAYHYETRKKVSYDRSEFEAMP